MSNNRDPGPIPNRWLYCPRKSDIIIAEKFLAFKTPLSNAYMNQMPIECIFLPEMIFGYCKTLKLKLGLWIDLTNTKRFYDRCVIESQGARYVKLQCRGHGETPSPEQTQAFIEIVHSFINERPFDIIGVHCTHGFNRTGFLIASYLVEHLDCSVEAALSMFARARAPGIYKQDYINELYRRYGDEEDATPAPELPSWCLEFDDSNHDGRGRKRPFDEGAHSSNSVQALVARQQHSNGSLCIIEPLDDDKPGGDPSDGNEETTNGSDENQTDDKDGTDRIKPRKRRRRELVIKNATFMEGVPGVVWVQDQPRLGELQQKVQDMCGWKVGGFPGAQPVSLDRNNINSLHEKPYRVSWKADGTRYMMLINKRDEIYFFDRNNSCFQVENLSFVKSSNLNQHLEDTLIDGEMVLDKYNGNIIPRYLIYDIIRICNFNIGKMPFFPDRLRCIKKELIDPRIRAIEKGIIHRPSEPFSIRNKEFWDIRQSASLLGEKFAKSLLHEPDGLIFQPSKEPYTPGACSDVFKWKPLEMNSVDFRMKIHTEEGQGILKSKVCLLFVGGFNSPFARMKYAKALKELDNKIIECTLNQRGHWEFMRERTDKTLPNSYNTAMSVIESIRCPITKEDLLNFIANYGFHDDDNMQPTHSVQHQHHRQQNHHHQIYHDQQEHQQQQHSEQQ